MRWFRNLKLFPKLAISFAVPLTLLLLISIINYYNLSSLNAEYFSLLDNTVAQQEQINKIGSDFLQLRRKLTRMPTIRDGAQIQTYRGAIAQGFTDVNSGLDKFQSMVNSDKSLSAAKKAEYTDTITSVKKLLNDPASGYVTFSNYIVDNTVSGNYDGAISYLDGVAKAAETIEAELAEQTSDFQDTINNVTLSINADTIRTKAITILLTVASLLIGAGFAVYLSGSLSKRLNAAAKFSVNLSEGVIGDDLTSDEQDEIGYLTRGIAEAEHKIKGILSDLGSMYERHNSGDIDYFIDPGAYPGAYSELIRNINDMVKSQIDMSKSALKCVGEIGKGNFSASVEVYPGKKAFINETIEELRANIKNVSKDINILIKAATDGNLSFRADASKFEGDWRALVNSLNELCDTTVAPIMESLRGLKELAKGNMSAKITGDYKGNFREIKDTFNFTSDELSKYISETGRVLKQISEANLDISINGNFIGDFSAIKDAILGVNKRLNDIIRGISGVTEQVSEGAKSISESGAHLASGASEQAGAVQELSATVETIGDKAKANAANADAASKMSAESVRGAQEGNTEMKRMLEAMEGIEDSSGKISLIIKTIEDIAFQTNLLALNAAVEAARAGEHGKGFSIVAEEVRGLAIRSQEAAKETAALIESTIDKVNGGASIAHATASSLDDIVKRVTEISGLISIISESSKEQSEAVSQINIGLSQIANIAAANASTSQESSAASQELSSQAESLYSMISAFKLSNDNGWRERQSA